MDKIKYYLDYDKQTTQVLFLGIEKNSEHSIELELDDEEYAELANDLDFMFIKNGKPVLDQNYKTKYLNGIKNRNRIDELKALLAATDWKVTVNAELFQVGLPLKYPNLHAERQAWRDEINELEGE